MRYIFFLLIFTWKLIALDIGSSFQANFVQIIYDEQGKEIIYKGKVYALKPQNILWSYEEPIQKDVYISQSVVTVVEPELEQAIVKSLDADLNLFELLQTAKQVSVQEYIAQYRDQLYSLYLKDTLLETIRYKDQFEHTIEISFSNQKKDQPIDAKLLTPFIPEGFDIIRQ